MKNIIKTRSLAYDYIYNYMKDDNKYNITPDTFKSLKDFYFYGRTKQAMKVFTEMIYKRNIKASRSILKKVLNIK